MSRLTPKQRRLVRELDEIVKLLRLNYREIHQYDPEERAPRLKLTADHFVRGEIVLAYTLIDEFLSAILCHHFFGRKISIQKLWRTRRFKNFNYFFIEKLSLMEKLAYVRAIREVPKSIRRDVEALNNLRNGVAHAFFPENLRSAKPKWKGLEVFSVEGVRRLMQDLAEIDDFLIQRAYGVKSTDRTGSPLPPPNQTGTPYGEGAAVLARDTGKL
jgi:hypothetical protein